MKSEWVLGTDEDRRRFAAALALLPLDKPLAVTVKPYRRRRTTSQNATHWWRLNALCDAIALDTGHTAQEIHDVVKARFCPCKPKTFEEPDGTTYTFAVRSTTLLDVTEMADFMTRVEAWAAETFGFEMPEPIPRNVREEIPA